MKSRGTVLATAVLALAASTAAVPSDEAERAAVLGLGPWPPAPVHDDSNRVSGRPQAIAFGEALFFSNRLSRTPGLRCATCHEPWRRFSDGRIVGLGARPGDRNTPTLLDVGQQRWFGWDGANDTLWGQSLRPVLDPREMASDAHFVATAMRGDARMSTMYRESFGAAPGADDEAVMVDLAKALAAYQETLVSDRGTFDDYRDALAAGDASAAARFPAEARRGLALFVGDAHCIACHAGSAFSDGRFHASTIASRLADGTPDAGRSAALERWAASPYSRRGRFNDGGQAREPEAAPANGFRTPGLREVSRTGPWMHDGSVANLCDAVRPHAADGPPVRLSLDQRRDLVAFLRALAAPPAPAVEDEDAFHCR